MKLAAPAFYKENKWKRFMSQWQSRSEFELLKAKHAIQLSGATAKLDPKLRRQMKDELGAFIAKAHEKDAALQMEDVYITDHVAKTKKFNTLSEEEDQQFYDYLKSVEEYGK